MGTTVSKLDRLHASLEEVLDLVATNEERLSEKKEEAMEKARECLEKGEMGGARAAVRRVLNADRYLRLAREQADLLDRLSNECTHAVGELKVLEAMQKMESALGSVRVDAVGLSQKLAKQQSKMDVIRKQVEGAF